eukprot:gnl/TRDRNA2_/TRDRNA2_37479_c0_seq1.p1 gnl/TRDRNA2_/TRDRNA2_37479_c0~~gnl/TRDRNA2_/TRDRNA2_37479_c0_seq1.p1  ORF type:complete len:371 (-),score=55.95 gnl/TRDRNA2_/TRDRNA2_37479_c0_seq1:66-1136(-)
MGAPPGGWTSDATFATVSNVASLLPPMVDQYAGVGMQHADAHDGGQSHGRSQGLKGLVARRHQQQQQQRVSEASERGFGALMSRHRHGRHSLTSHMDHNTLHAEHHHAASDALSMSRAAGLPHQDSSHSLEGVYGATLSGHPYPHADHHRLQAEPNAAGGLQALRARRQLTKTREVHVKGRSDGQSMQHVSDTAESGTFSPSHPSKMHNSASVHTSTTRFGLSSTLGEASSHDASQFAALSRNDTQLQHGHAGARVPGAESDMSAAAGEDPLLAQHAAALTGTPLDPLHAVHAAAINAVGSYSTEFPVYEPQADIIVETWMQEAGIGVAGGASSPWPLLRLTASCGPRRPAVEDDD